MNTLESKQLATTRRMCTALERIADALERQEEPVLIATAQPGEVTPFAVSWQHAVEVLIGTCEHAASCTKGDCPMYEWCDAALDEDLPPVNWPRPKGE